MPTYMAKVHKLSNGLLLQVKAKIIDCINYSLSIHFRPEHIETKSPAIQKRN